jgi:hypothetical protein
LICRNTPSLLGLHEQSDRGSHDAPSRDLSAVES